uniref:Uncharacterized protein n=1 Tax=Timema tahoe TaxID=61484 RepID=A0A7R9IP10_9NEOP|nr:unnamed protein product [Timema tahoe]
MWRLTAIDAFSLTEAAVRRGQTLLKKSSSYHRKTNEVPNSSVDIACHMIGWLEHLDNCYVMLSFIAVGALVDVTVWYYVKDVKIFDEEVELEEVNEVEAMVDATQEKLLTEST